MSLRQLSIQWKITLLAGLCLLGIVTLLVGLSLYRMEQSSQQVKASSMHMLDEAARARIEAQGEAQALGIRQQFMDAYQYGHGFSRQVLFLREQAEKRFLDAFDTREDLTRQVKAALQANPDLLGLSLVFEANALDGKDELFVNQPELGSNDKGRFAPLLVTADARQTHRHVAARKRHVRHQHRPERGKGQCLVHLPAHHPQTVCDRTVLLCHRRPKRTDDQPRVPAGDVFEHVRHAQDRPGHAARHQPHQPQADHGGEQAQAQLEQGATGVVGVQLRLERFGRAHQDFFRHIQQHAPRLAAGDRRERCQDLESMVGTQAADPRTAGQGAEQLRALAVVDLVQALAELAREYAADERGFQLREVAGGWRLYTHPAYHA